MYRIDEEKRTVIVYWSDDPTQYGKISFTALGIASSEDIAQGATTILPFDWSSITSGEWRLCYAIARDELIERGLIREFPEE